MYNRMSKLSIIYALHSILGHVSEIKFFSKTKKLYSNFQGNFVEVSKTGPNPMSEAPIILFVPLLSLVF